MAKRPIVWTGHEDAAWLAEKLGVVVKQICRLERALEKGEETTQDYLDRVRDIRIYTGIVVGGLFADLDDAPEINEIFRCDDSEGKWVLDLIYNLGRNSKYWKLTYPELLKLPEWQRKRLELLKAKRFRCEACEDSESSLHVHHKKYGHGLPWELPNSAFEVLCEKCHQSEHQ